MPPCPKTSSSDSGSAGSMAWAPWSPSTLARGPPTAGTLAWLASKLLAWPGATLSIFGGRLPLSASPINRRALRRLRAFWVPPDTESATTDTPCLGFNCRPGSLGRGAGGRRLRSQGKVHRPGSGGARAERALRRLGVDVPCLRTTLPSNPQPRGPRLTGLQQLPKSRQGIYPVADIGPPEREHGR